MRVFLLLLLPLVCICLAALLALKGIEGWGWFLFVAVLCSGADVVQKHVGNNQP